MPQAPAVTLENNFIGGLKTEFTGLNFPENSATDTDNCIYTLIGEVLRRPGIDFEANAVQNIVTLDGKAVSSYKWNNVGGDGNVQIIVIQVGGILYFFVSSAATIASPLSAKIIASTITLSSMLPAGSVNDPSVVECQYSDGNGLLFVTHPYLDPFFVSFNGTSVASSIINIKVRDFDGIVEPGVPTSQRPNATSPGLSVQHRYNLLNQGWTDGQYGDVLTTANIATFSNTTLVNYAGTTTGSLYGFFPSNSDVWFSFKDPRGTFNPCLDNLTKNTISSTPAPKGHFVLPAFNQDRNVALNTGGFTPIVGLPVLTSNNQRPSNTSFYTGRVFYTGINHPSYAETIYFSQVIDITADPTIQFGACFQQNDPTSETFFDLLPTDGGTIKIQGCGFIYKLFPIQNGILVFAANGIWFITGSQGIGFAANDHTITKISGVQSISSTSFVNVLGFPMFWNEEGIYVVQPSKQGGGLEVENLCIGTILGYYSNIPLQSKKFARGAYNPVDFIVQWTFRSTNEINVTTRYQFDKILNLNTSNKAFYPYSVIGVPKICGIVYVAGPGGSTSPAPTLKYITSRGSGGVSQQITFSEENDVTTYKDWFHQDSIGVNYNSYFVTGYRIHGQGVRRWQPGYVLMYSLNNTAYKIQNIWDYASDAKSGRWSAKQLISNTKPYFGSAFRRHRVRGQGLVNQIKISSVDGLPFNIYGWTVWENQNTSP